MDPGGAVADKDLAASAAANAEVFEDALVPYVKTKVVWATDKASSGWLDCTGCIWCVFDDERFIRQDLSDDERHDPALPYRLYWSIGDVCMPASATPAANRRFPLMVSLTASSFTGYSYSLLTVPSGSLARMDTVSQSVSAVVSAACVV